KHLHLLPPVRQTRLANCEESVAHLIAILLHAGGRRDDKLARTHARLLRTLTSRKLPLVAPGATRFSRLAAEMGQLAGLPLQDKRRVLELAATAVMADGKVELEEYELLRVVAALLDCPMPVMAI
ncbi:MAG: hypothetical protein Q8J78_12090, partial [Moraxellaceae bacterium]|nr:hypothetical protein [Moraxellaceae bacterium]